MFSENKPKYARIENRRVFILGVILLAVILVMMCCVLGIILHNQMGHTRTGN